MVDYPVSNLCPNCGGDGLDGTEFCLPCNGTGYVSSQGESLYRKDIKERVTSIKTKTDNLPDDTEEDFAELKAWCITVNQKLAYLKEKIDTL